MFPIRQSTKKFKNNAVVFMECHNNDVKHFLGKPHFMSAPVGPGFTPLLNFSPRVRRKVRILLHNFARIATSFCIFKILPANNHPEF